MDLGRPHRGADAAHAGDVMSSTPLISLNKPPEQNHHYHHNHQHHQHHLIIIISSPLHMQALPRGDTGDKRLRKASLAQVVQYGTGYVMMIKELLGYRAWNIFVFWSRAFHRHF
jgi:hypothetical protein